MTVTTASQSRLQTIRERTHAARDQRARARQQLDAAREVGDFDAGAIAQLAFDAADVELQTAERLESQILSSMAGVDSNGFRESLFDNPQTVETLQRLGDSTFPIGRIDLGPLSSRDDLVAMIESGSWHGGRYGAAGDVQVPDAARVGPYYGTVPQLQRRLRLLDLIPTSTMDGRSFVYTQAGGALDTAFEVSEGAVKPQADLELTEAECVAKTIAHWAKLSRPQLADVPQLSTIITTRLSYGVMRRVEDQIIGGDGVGENLTGLLNTSGIGDVPHVAGPLTDLALDGITAVLLSDAEPNAVVVNPQDWSEMLKATATGSGERLDSDGAFATPPIAMWGLPTIPSKVMPKGQALVGDWSVGATLFVREPVNVRISDADSDDFSRNRLTALGEGRFGLAVFQPTAFVLVHFV